MEQVREGWTPVKVRGKRGSRKNKRRTASQSDNRKPDVITPKPMRKTKSVPVPPRRTDNRLIANDNRLITHDNRLIANPLSMVINPYRVSPARRVSAIERLPTEILEMILVKSCNPSLALSSPILARALQGCPSSLFSDMVLSSFEKMVDFLVVDEINETDTEILSAVMQAPATTTPIRYNQHKLLSSRLFTAAALRDIERTFAVNFYRAYFDARQDRFDEKVFANLNLFLEYLQRPFVVPENAVLSMPYKYTANNIKYRGKFELTFERVDNYSPAVISLSDVKSSNIGQSTPLIISLQYPFVRCSLPECKLLGPWTHDKVELLSMLERLEIEIDYTSPTIYDTMVLGVQSAIRNGPFRAVTTLMRIYKYDMPQFVAMRILEIAVIDEGCDPFIVDCVTEFRNYPLSSFLHSQALFNWTINARKSGNPKGYAFVEFLERDWWLFSDIFERHLAAMAASP